ncbi:hypothetical protein CLG85_018205 [Yangia mangrovi]|uniref:Uncharacterized protein n=1 Tax=Alloyangia mangrovi TaxID=1779329 RepID=A0A2A3JS63_9RHOB|nr:hypothetical protein [Alloyangia mangrovi]MCA0940161.1 hypothetical protein [Alloyangia pacifica]MCA0945672.1 hypothetical protein [Alloyangia pacifica]MCT4372140.1 hypothetical protein [Alloyangia mangrovi]
MTKTTLLRLQITSFVLVHIPLFALVLYALTNGVAGRLDLLLVALLATVVAAIAIWMTLGRALGGGVIPAQKSA